MCILIIQEYTDCSHYSTTLKKCPAFQKLQNRDRGLFSALFGCAEPRRKDCGRIAHHHALSMPALCDKCIARRNQSSRGQHPTAVDKDHHRDQREPYHKDARRQRQQQQHSERTRHARDKFAQTEAYKKSPARALPASSGSSTSASEASGSGNLHSRTATHRQNGSSQKQQASRSGTKVREGHPKKMHGQRRRAESPSVPRISTHRAPACDHVDDDEGEPPPLPVPMRKPTQPAQPAPTYQHRGRFPVAVAAVSRPSQGTKRERVAEAVELEVAGSAAGAPHQLRRKPAKTYLNLRNQPLKPIPAPLPEYQVYLNAMPSLEEGAIRRSQDSGKSQETTASSFSASGGKASRDSAGSSTGNRDSGKYLRKRSALASLGRAMGLEPPQRSPFSDNGSDLSFVCSDSRKLAETGREA